VIVDTIVDGQRRKGVEKRTGIRAKEVTVDNPRMLRCRDRSRHDTNTNTQCGRNPVLFPPSRFKGTITPLFEWHDGLSNSDQFASAANCHPTAT
jgi:hypothetical protein